MPFNCCDFNNYGHNYDYMTINMIIDDHDYNYDYK